MTGDDDSCHCRVCAWPVALHQAPHSCGHSPTDWLAVPSHLGLTGQRGAGAPGILPGQTLGV